MNRFLFVFVTAVAVAVLAEQVSVGADGRTKKRKKKKAKQDQQSKQTMLVVVDTVKDYDPKHPGANMRSCSTSSVMPENLNDTIASSLASARGECSLRSAIEMAGGLGGGSSVTIALRPGRFRLAAPLPDIQGTVRIMGSIGTLRGTTKKKKKKKGSEDADDDVDYEYDPNLKGQHQVAPIGTTLDGGSRFQIMRTGYGSKVKVSNVRFENGVAMDSVADDLRATLGGALNSLGEISLANVVMRRNRAINGGAVYAEGKTFIKHGTLTDNVADRCGGFIYTAGNAKISQCSVMRNTHGHFDCKKVDSSGKPGAKLPSWRKRRPSGNFDDADDDDDESDAKAGADDASGAVTEGPPLTLTPAQLKEAEAKAAAEAAANQRGEGAAGTAAPTKARPKKRRRKGQRRLRDDEEAELDTLASEVDDEWEEEARQRALEEEDEEATGLAGVGGALGGAKGAAAAAEPKGCDAEKHGGQTGALHELSCESGLWRTGRKMPTECVRWRATANCSSEGERKPDEDRSCFEFVPAGASGYCDCPGGVTTAHSSCEHEPFTCQRACRSAREKRRRDKARQKRQAGLPPKPTLAPTRLFAIGAFGAVAGRSLGGLGLICSDGSRTALAGRAPETQEQQWEFVCPGWELCQDADTSWDPVTKKPLCAAWAARGECAANPDFMRQQCARSCNACAEASAPAAAGAAGVAGASDATSVDAAAGANQRRLGLASMDVRAGLYVDALRFHCAPETPDASSASSTGQASPATSGSGVMPTLTNTLPMELGALARELAPAPNRSSDWFGGSGGDECPLACDGGASGPSWRVGGLIEGLVVAGGDLVDRLELTKCTEDVEL